VLLARQKHDVWTGHKWSNDPQLSLTLRIGLKGKAVDSSLERGLPHYQHQWIRSYYYLTENRCEECSLLRGGSWERNGSGSAGNYRRPLRRRPRRMYVGNVCCTSGVISCTICTICVPPLRASAQKKLTNTQNSLAKFFESRQDLKANFKVLECCRCLSRSAKGV